MLDASPHRSDGSGSPLTCQRHAFDLPADICWLNSAYMSPLLHGVREAADAGVALRAAPWRLGADDFFSPAERVRELFAQLVNTQPNGVALTPSVSYAVAVAAKNVFLPNGGNIVVVAEQFPSNIYPWRELARERDAEVRTIAIPDRDRTSAILSGIDERTAVVAIPHVHWTTGAQFDLERIAARAREVGAALLVDATQSLGVLPFDVARIQPDFLVATAYKCLLGPYGLCYFYVAPKWRSGRPLEEAWLNRAHAADFSRLTEYRDEYVAGARRFDFGERANPVLLPMAIASLTQILDWGVERIQAYTRPLIEQILDRADRLGLTHVPHAECSPCMAGIGLSVNSPQALAKLLAAEGIYVSIRKSNARIAPHVYNTAGDVDRLFDRLSAHGVA